MLIHYTSQNKFYKISYDLDGGTNNSSNPTTYTYSSDKISLLAPTKEGYTFLGWTTSDNDEPVLEYVIEAKTTGDISLTANWIVYELSITNGNLDAGKTNYTDVTTTSAIISFNTKGGSTLNAQTVTANNKLTVVPAVVFSS